MSGGEQQYLINNLKNMIDYIKSDCANKCNQIKKDGEMEAAKEKSKMLDPEKEKIQRKIIKELDEFKVKVKITESQKKNKLRLEKLKLKIELVNSVVDEAKEALVQKLKDRASYKQVLMKLIIQGLIKLLESEVNIICKKEDIDLIKGVVEEAKKEFTKLMHEQTVKFKKLELTITIDQKYHLPEYIIGGVMLTAMKSKIRVDNTIDKRLEILRQSAIPEIRNLLFGN